ncbi:hypothetical protein PAPYR_12921 [Paratrimastix pyriformis]|uniref:DUF7869 domain-containing protein n=1 Tax=Paratrimastix pyriformis TaxID=342808 RepID=A0ABQ8U4S8_9EUKA|nr:hypothetical protein PAPYR_12921 [Paratrimastix pyriformis]
MRKHHPRRRSGRRKRSRSINAARTIEPTPPLRVADTYFEMINALTRKDLRRIFQAIGWTIHGFSPPQMALKIIQELSCRRVFCKLQPLLEQFRSERQGNGTSTSAPDRNLRIVCAGCAVPQRIASAGSTEGSASSAPLYGGSVSGNPVFDHGGNPEDGEDPLGFPGMTREEQDKTLLMFLFLPTGNPSWTWEKVAETFQVGRSRIARLCRFHESLTDEPAGLRAPPHGNTDQVDLDRRARDHEKVKAVLAFVDGHVTPSVKDPDIGYYESLRSLHRAYLRAETAPKTSWSFFRRTIRLARPNYRSRPAYSDVCAICLDQRERIQALTLQMNAPWETKDGKEAKQAELARVHAEQEGHRNTYTRLREDYNARRTTAAYSHDRDDVIRVDTDFKMDYPLPHPPAQTQAFFFESKMMLYIFGIIEWRAGHNDMPERDPTFYLYPEHVAGHKSLSRTFVIVEASPLVDDANHVVSLLDNYLEQRKGQGLRIDLQADNCAPQNKNNTLIGVRSFWLYACERGWFDSVTMHFMAVGHTKFSCDSAFGGLTRLLKGRSTVGDGIITPTDVADLLGPSRARVPAPSVFRDWHEFLLGRYRRLPGLSRMHEIHFSLRTPGKVKCKANLDEDLVEYDLRIQHRRQGTRDIPAPSAPAVLPPVAFTAAKQKALDHVISMLPSEKAKAAWKDLIKAPFDEARKDGRPIVQRKPKNAPDSTARALPAKRGPPRRPVQRRKTRRATRATKDVDDEDDEDDDDDEGEEEGDEESDEGGDDGGDDGEREGDQDDDETSDGEETVATATQPRVSHGYYTRSVVDTLAASTDPQAEEDAAEEAVNWLEDSAEPDVGGLPMPKLQPATANSRPAETPTEFEPPAEPEDEDDANEALVPLVRAWGEVLPPDGAEEEGVEKEWKVVITDEVTPVVVSECAKMSG